MEYTRIELPTAGREQMLSTKSGAQGRRPLGSSMVCRVCDKKRMLSDFHQYKDKSYHPDCVDCRSTYSKEYYEENKERIRYERTKYNYGVTQDEYEEMHANQSGLCAICKIPSDKTLHIDHDHDTGKVRALLCGYCNTALGGFRDDPEILRRAAQYVEDHRG